MDVEIYTKTNETNHGIAPNTGQCLIRSPWQVMKHYINVEPHCEFTVGVSRHAALPWTCDQHGWRSGHATVRSDAETNWLPGCRWAQWRNGRAVWFVVAAGGNAAFRAAVANAAPGSAARSTRAAFVPPAMAEHAGMPGPGVAWILGGAFATHTRPSDAFLVLDPANTGRDERRLQLLGAGSRRITQHRLHERLLPMDRRGGGRCKIGGADVLRDAEQTCERRRQRHNG